MIRSRTELRVVMIPMITKQMFLMATLVLITALAL